MPELSFDCTGVSPDRYAAAPMLSFHLRITAEDEAQVHAMALRCQLRIEPMKRRYDAAEEEQLLDLFGDRSRWADTMNPIQFATVSVMVPGFKGSTEIDLPVPCSYDLEVSAGRYFQALEDGEIPLLLLFSGSVFWGGPGRLNVEQVPWDREASVRVPVSTWREVMDLHFPNAGWLRIDRTTVDALTRFKARRVIATWDETLMLLLKEAGEEGDG